MRRADHRTLRARLWLLLILVSLLCLFFFLSADREAYGHLRVTVLDAYTLNPVEGAYVLLPESGLSSYTDASGVANIFSIPVVKNPGQHALLAQTWGETTVLVYAPGYREYALFYAQVSESRVRLGPSIYLFPESEQGLGPITVIEAPMDSWVEELMNLYRPS